MPDGREIPDPFRDYRAKIGHIHERIGTAFSGDGDVDEPLGSRISRWMQHFGFSSYPPGGTEIAVIETDAGPCAIASDHLDGEPDLAPGWSAQYDTSGNLVQLMTSDGVKISNAAGKLVLENGAGLIYIHEAGSLAAARKTDAVTPTSIMATWMAAVSSHIGISPPTTFGAITGGSSNVKIG